MSNPVELPQQFDVDANQIKQWKDQFREVTGVLGDDTMDIGYVPIARGFVYLYAVVDWFSRRVLSCGRSPWRRPCIEAVEEALARYDKSDIFNTDSDHRARPST